MKLTTFGIPALGHSITRLSKSAHPRFVNLTMLENVFMRTFHRPVWTRPQVYSVAAALLFLTSHSASAANWYIDSAASTSGNGQSWSSAFKTFSAIPWSSISAGDTIYISGGTTSKTYSSSLVVGKSGTSSNRITIRVGQDAGHTGTVILDGANIQVMQNYITIDGGMNGVANLKIKNVTNSSKDNAWAVEANGSTGLILKYVGISNCNNGVNLTYGINYEVSNSTISVRGDAGIRGIVSSGSWDANKIHDNFLESLFNGGGPDTIQVGNGTSIYRNTFKVTTDSSALSGQHTDNLQLAGENIKIYDNEFINIGDSNIDYDGWASGALRNIYIYNNLFRLVQDIDPYPDFMRFYSTGAAMNTVTNLKILNNTFIDARPSHAGLGQLTGFGFGGGTGAGTGNEYKNNLFVGTPSGMKMNMDSGGSQFSMAFSNNIYPYAISMDPSGKVGVPSLDTNFVLTAADTLARDKGVTLTLFAVDKNGTPRPQGSAWDIGAFEYSGSSPSAASPPTTLSTPTNLIVQ